MSADVSSEAPPEQAPADTAAPLEQAPPATAAPPEQAPPATAAPDREALEQAAPQPPAAPGEEPEGEKPADAPGQAEGGPARSGLPGRLLSAAGRLARGSRPVWADIALVVVVIGVWVRIDRWQLRRPLWLDEQMISLNIREQGYSELIGDLAYRQSAPLGWLWAQRLLVEEYGATDQVMRVLALAFGIGTVLVAWWIGRRWLSPVGAVVLTALCAFAPQLLRYSDEVKQYSADTFWTLLLLGLAAWALEGPKPARRVNVWWAVAAVGAWFSMAAVLVAPGLVVVMLVSVLIRFGWRAALWAVPGGFAWLVSFACLYLLSLRYAISDDFLVGYWKVGFPPEPATLDSTLGWLHDLPGVLTEDPIKTEAGSVFWWLVVAGLIAALCYRRRLGALLVSPLIAASVLAVLRIAPISARLALWLVPVLFLAVAVGVDAPVRWAADLGRRAAGRAGSLRRWSRWAVGVLAAVACVATVSAAEGAVEVVQPQVQEVEEPLIKPNLDDRSAIQWLDANRRPGDVVLVNHHAWSAVLWYSPRGSAPVSQPVRNLAPAPPTCDPDQFARVLRGHRRALFYSGIRLTPYPHTNWVVAAHLAEHGRITAVKRWYHSEIYVVDLTARPAKVNDYAWILPRQPLNCVRVDPPRGF